MFASPAVFCRSLTREKGRECHEKCTAICDVPYIDKALTYTQTVHCSTSFFTKFCTDRLIRVCVVSSESWCSVKPLHRRHLASYRGADCWQCLHMRTSPVHIALASLPPYHLATVPTVQHAPFFSFFLSLSLLVTSSRASPPITTRISCDFPALFQSLVRGNRRRRLTGCPLNSTCQQLPTIDYLSD